MEDRQIRQPGSGRVISPPPPQAPVIRRVAQVLECDLPADGVRIRVRPQRGTTRFAVGLASVAGLMAAGLWAAAATITAPGLLASLVLGSVGGLVWCATRGLTAYVAFDRHGIHDAAGGRQPLAWSEIDRLETGPSGRGPGQALHVRLVQPAAGASPILAGTAEAGLPVPFEYFVVQLRRRGAPIREPDPAFDPFDCDARWLPAPRAAALLVDRLGARARPHAGQQLDIAETRGDRPAVGHWCLVLAALHARAGNAEIED